MKVILVDDEQLALDFFERQLQKVGNVEVVGKYANPLMGKERIIHDEVDVVFLDIHLPEINGLEMAEQIIEAKPGVHIVFVTAYDEFAVKAFELNALDYLVKPVNTERMSKTIARIEQQVQQERQFQQAQQVLHAQSGVNDGTSIQTMTTLSLNIGTQVMIENETLHWRTTKAQELFLLLLQHRRQLLHKGEIVELMWPEMEPERAFSQLYTTIYHIRKTLKKYSGHFKIANAKEGYTLTTDQLVINLEEWEQGIATAPPLTMETIQHYVDLMKLNTGIYLLYHDYIWTETERQRLERTWLKTAFQIADCYHENGATEEAITWYIGIETRHPEAEEAYFALMKIYATKKNHLLVKRQYHDLRKVLEKELDVQPSANITNWYREWENN